MFLHETHILLEFVLASALDEPYIAEQRELNMATFLSGKADYFVLVLQHSAKELASYIGLKEEEVTSGKWIRPILFLWSNLTFGEGVKEIFKQSHLAALKKLPGISRVLDNSNYLKFIVIEEKRLGGLLLDHEPQIAGERVVM